MTSHSPASSPELPKPAVVSSQVDSTMRAMIVRSFSADQMNAHYLNGYEAGSAAAAQAAWRPIAEAPKDMAAHIYLVNGRCVQGFVDATGVLCVQPDNMPWRKMKGKPTHWAPLLKLPAAPTGEQA